MLPETRIAREAEPSELSGSGGLLAELARTSEAEARDLLARLLIEHVQPVVDRVLRARLGGDEGVRGDQAEISDLRSEILLQVVDRLTGLRRQPAGAPIGDLASYVAAVARNACWDHLRRRHAGRDRLRRRLSHLLANDPRFSLWQAADGQWHCALAAGRTGGAPLEPNGDGRRGEEDRAAWADLARLAAGQLARTGQPLPVTQLVSLVGEELGAAPGPREQAADWLESVPDRRPDAATALAFKRYLAALWAEIRELPERQCAALLLGLRDRTGRSALLLLPSTGTASIRQIAEALHLSLQRFAELWNRLPLEDLEIARLLGLTRQQVINLRKSARERLLRRMDRRGLPW